MIEKLEKCYNTDNDPRTEGYKKRRLEQFQAVTDYEARNLVNILEFHRRKKHLYLLISF